MKQIAERGRGARPVLVNDRGRRVGESHHGAKLTDADVDLIHTLAALGLSQQAIADKFDDIEGGVSRSTVRDILNGRNRGQAGMARKPRGQR